MIINGIEWRVRAVPPSHPFLLTPWKTHAYGMCDKNTYSVYIDNTLSPRKKKEVLAHEIAHAVIFSYDIDLTYEEEEIVADIFSSHGTEIMKWTNIIYDVIKMK